MSMCGCSRLTEGFRLRPTTFQSGECFKTARSAWTGAMGQKERGEPTSDPRSPMGPSDGCVA